MTTKNPIENFQLDKKDIRFLGEQLHKPTAIIATPDECLWVTDARGGVTKISLVTEQQQLISDPKCSADQFSSMLFVGDNKMMLANVGADCIELFDLTKTKREVLYNSIDGVPIGKVNFLLQDSKKRIWVTVSTKQADIISAFNPDISDGYIAVIENNHIRVVAEGFAFTNEARLDDAEQYLYISETGKKRIVRMKINADSTLGDKEIYGPADLGPANFPDGITFDSYGNLWGTIVGAEKIFAITPEGDLKIIYDDGDLAAIKNIEAAYQQRTLTREILFSGISKITPLMTSLTFAGKDFYTVYIGSYGTTLPYFTAPVSGQKARL
jgi:gluconolactonase